MVGINYLAVGVCTLINMVLGGLWYSPVLFGKKMGPVNGLGSREDESRSNCSEKCSTRISSGHTVSSSDDGGDGTFHSVHPRLGFMVRWLESRLRLLAGLYVDHHVTESYLHEKQLLLATSCHQYCLSHGWLIHSRSYSCRLAIDRRDNVRWLTDFFVVCVFYFANS